MLNNFTLKCEVPNGAVKHMLKEAKGNVKSM